MKRPIVIGLILLLFLAACHPEQDDFVETQNLASQQPIVSEELQAVDSLMWQRPDSALALLLPWFDTVDSNETFDNHYAHLLLAELLYKNDYAQTNREALLAAVAYFDSLVRQTPPLKGGRGDSRHALDQKGNPAFLSARAHYINGVGYYEQDSVVEACREYIKALEIMESRFEEKELVEHKARFLAYTYNRLGDLFSEQFMMESAITCYENALVYCKISPTSPIGIPNILYRLGKQYDKKNEIENASLYYGQALENMAATDNMVYRNIVASKALCDYEMYGDVKQAMEELNYALIHAKTEKERLNRYLTIGGVFFYEGKYDSALFYLEPVFEDKEAGLQTQAAGYLRIIYDSIGDREQSDAYMRFLTNHMKPEGENKALVSQLEDMYKDYSNQKLEKQAETERETAKKKVLNTVIPIAVTIAIVVFLVLILRGRRLLKNQQEEADRAFGEAEKKHLQWMADAEERHSEELRAQKDRSEKEIEKTKTRHQKELEAERLAYEKEQNALRQHLTERTAQVHALEEALNQQREEVKLRRVAFLKEPICQSIRNKLSGKNITTRENAYELGIALKDEDFEQLRAAVEKHYEGFDQLLLSQCPGLKQGHLALCHLHLLGINESEIAVLKNVSYSAIKKQNESLLEKLGIKEKESVAKYVLRVAEGLCGTQNVTQSGTQIMATIIEDDLDTWIESQVVENPKITTDELAKKSHKSIRTIKRHIAAMEHIRYIGSGYSGHWEVTR